jgi:hypothetical protein
MHTWRLQLSKLPCFGSAMPTSLFASFTMFLRLGGTGTPRHTENARPWAWPGPWYGSWPSTTTRTL